ncbi:hypothetical protein [Salinibacterium sp. PAMC 21357]|uniref:hypothetical protein n=1 Tax=Salinibacterium sp. PAMC 21357 TaxID=1112215 RepID=UPI000289D6C7|nr:hypothetical protein [Salinibacterium sp. PAMC 21357]
MSAATESVTIQQLDPLGTLDGRPVSVASAFGIFALATVMTFLHSQIIVHLWMAGASLMLIGTATALMIFATGPLRAPFSGEMHAVVIGLLIMAYALSSAALGSGGSMKTDIWAPLIIGIACMALAPYRPVVELVAAGVTASIFVGFVALVSYSVSRLDAPAMIVILAAMTPVLTMSLGGSAFAFSLAKTHVRWEFRARRAARRQLDREQVSVARSVQQDRVTILNRDVVPLFVDITQRGIISPDDRARAAQYSESIRELMVTELNRSWLESVVANSFGALDDGNRVQDPHRLAAAMTSSQRTALRAAVLAVANGDELDPESVRLVIEKTATGATIIVTGTVTSSESSWRSSLAPYLAVLRVVFTGLRISYRSPSLIVRFTYDTP